MSYCERINLVALRALLRSHRIILLLGAFLVGACISTSVQASVINQVTLDVSQVIDGGTPDESAPWLHAVFEDHGIPGTVTLTIEGMNLSEGEFIGDLYFNLDPTLDPKKLQLSSPVISGTFDEPTFSAGKNTQKAGGDGYYDLEFNFSSAHAGRFDSGDSYQVTITSTEPITANSFNFPSSEKDNGSKDSPYYSAIHIQGVVGSKSIWAGSFQGIAVPEPSSLVPAIFGLAGLGLCGWRRWN